MFYGIYDDKFMCIKRMFDAGASQESKESQITIKKISCDIVQQLDL